MPEIVYGRSRRPVIARMLAEELSHESGSLYLGFPLLATADEPVIVDALLLSPERGLTVIVLNDSVPSPDQYDAWEGILDEQDRVVVALQNNLMRHRALLRRRELAFPINVITIFPSEPPTPPNEVDLVPNSLGGIGSVKDLVATFSPIEPTLVSRIEAALQAVTTMKPRKRREAATKPDSRGGVLKLMEQEVSKLDQWQKQAAIESPDGPQRIRGLAGTGKTIVLALKAAYLHTQNPDWKIALTFYSRSLYQQFIDLARRFTYEHMNDEPNWENLRVIHAWGSSGRAGVYSEIATAVGAPIRDFRYGRTKFGMEGAFGGVCDELLNSISSAVTEPIYDAILIDEAQDLPPAFFRLVHRFTKDPKRITVAYDELQRISETSMPTVEDWFGVDGDGEPVVRFYNTPGEPRRDITLKVCYRNPPEALTAAHALGLGIYREEEQIQGFDDPRSWLDIGYQLIDGELLPGSLVRLRRDPTSFPPYFPQLLNRNDIVLVQRFEDAWQQANWVAESIQHNLKSDQLDPDDVLIVLPTARTAKSEAVLFSQALERLGIESHLAGVTSSQDELFDEHSVAMAHIFRSKGNEASMVYVVNAQDYMAGSGQISLRNALFTAITRSRAWVRICGWGSLLDPLDQEIQSLVNNDYDLRFTLLPTEELERRRTIHRELTAGERERYRQVEQSARRLVEAVQSGDTPLETLPSDIRRALEQLFKEGSFYDDTESNS